MSTETRERQPGIPEEIDRDSLSDDQVERIARGHVRRLAFTGALGGLLYGYDTGVISGTLITIGQEFKIGAGVQELVTASILVGAVIGAFFTSGVSRRLGRRRTTLIVAAVFLLGVVFAGISPGPATLIASRVFLGLAVGGSTQVIPTYIAEMSPPKRRGRMVTLFNCAIGVGILAAAFVNVALNGVVSWRWMIMFASAPAIVLLLGMLVLPESPRWLVSKGEVSRARRVLHWARPSLHAADQELAEIRDLAKKSRGSTSEWRIIREKWVRPALIAGIGVAIFTQLTGLEMMIYYTPTILTDAGFPHVFSLWANVGVGVVYLVMTFTGSRLVDRIGRRRLPLITLPGAMLSLVAFGVVLVVGGKHPSPGLTIGLLLLFMFFQAGGIQVIGWLLESELYPLRVRATATSLQATFLWGSDLLVTVTALTLVSLLGLGGAMWVYAALNAIAWVFIFFRLPETKGRSLEEIEGSLHEGRFLPLASQRR